MIRGCRVRLRVSLVRSALRRAALVRHAGQWGPHGGPSLYRAGTRHHRLKPASWRG